MKPSELSRRNLLKSSTAAGAAAFTIVKPQLVRGWGKEKLKAGLVGCGGRGTQAVVNMLSGDPSVEFVAMADIFEDHLERSIRRLNDAEGYLARNLKNVPELTHTPPAELIKSIQSRIKVEPTSRFIGWDAYKKLLASDIDIVMLATPPGYRPEHFEAAINANKHVFCEKPFGTDPVGVKRFLRAARQSEIKHLSVMAGAQRRSQNEYIETVDKIQNGAIGDVRALYAYWVGTPVIQQKARNPKWGDMEWEHRDWYSFVWICGDQVVEQHLHNIDVCNWVMGTHPVKVWASGGAAWRPRTMLYGNIYDHLSADFEYANGVRMSSYCRQYPRQRDIYRNVSERVVGSKGTSNARDMGKIKLNPYVREHQRLLDSIRGDGPYVNLSVPVAHSTMTCIMAREAAYSGQELTWDDMMTSNLDLQPKKFGYDVKMNVPPLPVPGKYKFI